MSMASHPLADKVKAIQDYLQPTSVRKIQEFLGMVNFNRRFIPNCADILRPLTDLLTRHGKEKKKDFWFGPTNVLLLLPQ